MAGVSNPMKAIKAKCLDCCCGNAAEVKLCPAQDCPLHPFRLGRNPFRAKREYSDEERAALAERLAAARAKQHTDSKENEDNSGM